jgi:hypothetical protein
MNEDIVSIKIEGFSRHISQGDLSYRSLIASIINQAFVDALGTLKDKEAQRNKKSAISFINENNKLFVFYCNLLDIEPKLLAEKMQTLIKTSTFYKKKELLSLQCNIV